MAEPKEYVGQFSNPYKVITIEGVPDTSAYAAGDVLFRDVNNQAFVLPCATLGSQQLVDIEYLVVRELAVGGAVQRANIQYRFSRVGGTSWTVPAMGNPFNAPPNMADALGSVDVVTADYQDWKIAGAIVYTIACVPIPAALRRILRSASNSTFIYTVPTIGSGTPTFPAASLITTDFHLRQH